MTKEEFAALLNGREYGNEITSDEYTQAKALGLVVLFGYSDDNMEFRGAINDEIGCFDGRTVLIDKDGLLPSRESIDDDDELEKFFPRRRAAKEIEAIWDKDGYSWTYKTDIPHAIFDIIEDGEKYCRGIVFAMVDLA